ncbi:putative glucose-methanol-choline oxidoreductase [Eremomyces bilateralis CBS 781.70]|uniref:Glucose-methanol-choline oxidoreductase n=1 Tax=Eremomyces bilateralis CBS 781.70 TaxID=1392243 RepID=A0A6G1G466_9PEZI|nr:putative glucose-methanol-choline oxidoreductase [Eremomyces bilateralis CBS 781.70]KAF1812895.1 putative glucose-methanol-choline oxidoreductase [Eremomyces bilateralis CBS 781.70]
MKIYNWPALLPSIQLLFGIAEAVKPIGSSFGVSGRDATFDYVVVGGGTSGLTIAARLAEEYSVAVIEAGGIYQVDNGVGSTIPGLVGIQFLGSDPADTHPAIDWGFVTVPQKPLKDRRVHYARGKTLGGSSARNFMAYTRPSKGAMQTWANEVGDKSYTWENTLPFFKRSVSVTKPDLTKRFPNASVEEDYSSYDNSQNGPLHITWPAWASPFASWFKKAAFAIGMDGTSGFTNGKLLGSSWFVATINPKTMERESSATSFLKYATDTTGLLVYKQTLAKKILFNEEKAANAVVVETLGLRYTLSATKEVILSAGAVQSPQLLMVSGVGPKKVLEGLNIPVIANLPGVGQNLEDHPLSCSVRRVNLITASRMLNDPEYAMKVQNDYVHHESGPLTSPAGVIAFEKFPSSVRKTLSKSALDKLKSFPADWPDLEYAVLDASMGYNRNYLTEDPMDGSNYASVCVSIQTAFSRGSVSISSTDIADPPVLDVGWLSDPVDVELQIAALRRTRQVWEAMSEITIGSEYLPGPNVTSDAEILDFLVDSLTWFFHASATCKMGKPSDKMAVVDTKARVFGVKNLRVVDASAFPFLPPGHPQSVCYMLAEKIAEDIKNDDTSRQPGTGKSEL